MVLSKAIRLGICVLLPLIWALEVPAQPAKIGTITFLVGGTNDVMVRHRDSTTWVPAKLKMDLFEGDVVRTAKESRVEVTLLDKSLLRIGEQSEFVLTTATLTKKSRKVQSELSKGKLWVNITEASGSRNFQVKAPTAVCAVRGTIYRVEADSTTTVLVYDGAVDIGPLSKLERTEQKPTPRSLEPRQIPGPYEVPPPYQVTLEEWIRIVRGFQVTVRPDGKYHKRRFNEAEDARLEWVRWNKERDRQVRSR
ncbi:MAG: FecR domain-containing protein [candidate division KSB1 bacterium]|nr:FecR domain-containing protein [candidate division KSB1 bacterium]